MRNPESNINITLKTLTSIRAITLGSRPSHALKEWITEATPEVTIAPTGREPWMDLSEVADLPWAPYIVAGHLSSDHLEEHLALFNLTRIEDLTLHLRGVKFDAEDEYNFHLAIFNLPALKRLHIIAKPEVLEWADSWARWPHRVIDVSVASSRRIQRPKCRSADVAHSDGSQDTTGILLSPLCVIARVDRLHELYPGGMDHAGVDAHDARLARFDAADDGQMARIIWRLTDAGLRRFVKEGDEADMVFLQPPFVTKCRWLDISNGTARFVGVPDPKWHQHTVLLNWGEKPPYPWLDNRDPFLFAADVAGLISARDVLARALSRLAMENILRNDFVRLPVRHADGRKDILDGRGASNAPFAMSGSNLAFRNITDILTAGWLAEICAGDHPTNLFEGITLREVNWADSTGRRNTPELEV